MGMALGEFDIKCWRYFCLLSLNDLPWQQCPAEQVAGGGGGGVLPAAQVLPHSAFLWEMCSSR